MCVKYAPGGKLISLAELVSSQGNMGLAGWRYKEMQNFKKKNRTSVKNSEVPNHI